MLVLVQSIANREHVPIFVQPCARPSHIQNQLWIGAVGAAAVLRIGVVGASESASKGKAPQKKPKPLNQAWMSAKAH